MIDDKHYIIVHAGYIEEKVYEKVKISLLMRGMSSIEKFYIWAREEAIYEGGLSGATIISGHTPTIADTIFYNDGRISKIKHNGCKFIDIDCGYVFKNIDKHANLACFKLDDETVTYLE
jgi:serine/threonine protein phosphatase 1